ncbi:MAG: efflux RND transporter permease subunit [Bernardetiaceae bacterium]
MEPSQKKTRSFWLSDLALDNRTSVFILSTIITIFGILSYQQTAKELFPEIVMPQIYINTIYPGNSPADIENLITRPIEKEIKSVKGVTDIKSTSVQDVSAIVVEFEEDVEVSKALNDIKDAVDKAKSELPSDLENDPSVQELDFSETPIMLINLAGEFEVDKLKKYAEYLEDKIEELTEISEVEITGSVDREIQINADLRRMEAMMVSFSDIEQAVANENLTLSGGNILMRDNRRSVRIVGEFKTAEEIAGIIVKSEKQRPIYLRDIAEVVDTYEEREGYARLAGPDFATAGNAPVISLLVKKRGGENLLLADEKIKDIIAKAQQEVFPKNLKVVITSEQSDQIRSQLSDLLNSIISGVILVVAVLLFFMGLRNALLVGAAIPLSMLITFIVLNFSGVTMNIVVLFALILALGMLVDNAIVVIENIYRLLEEGMPPLQAAREGVGEVALPIIFSTATTLGAFVPLAFWGGILGEFMKYMPITLIIVLSSSLFVGLVINPVFTKNFARVKSKDTDLPKRQRQSQWLSLAAVVLSAGLYAGISAEALTMSYALPNLLMTFALITFLNVYLLTPAADWFQGTLLTRIENIYLATLRFFLKGYRPALLTVGMFFVMAGSAVLMISNAPAVEFFPQGDPNEVYVYVELPLGTDIEKTNRFVQQIESRVFTALTPYKPIVKSVITNVGEATNDPTKGSLTGGGAKSYRSKLTIAFKEFKLREGISSSEAMNSVSDAIKGIPGAKISLGRDEGGPPTGRPLSIEIIGDDYTVLLQESEKVKKAIEALKIPGIDQLEIEAETGKPELTLKIDREKARKYGLSTGLIGSTIRTALFGKEISKIKEGDEDYPIQLRLAREYRYDLGSLLNQRISFRDNQGKMHQIPISAVAEVEYSTALGEIKRKDLNRLVIVSSNVKEGYNANAIVEQVKGMMRNYELPVGYTYRFGGEQEEQAKSLAFLSRAFALALAAIFFLLVSQFNSFTKPFIIFMSILFSTTGVFLGLFIFRDNFVIIMTSVGIISLAGVVVNNAIVLIDYIDLTRERRRNELGLQEGERMPMDEIITCVVKGGYTRLRPVLLTAITTVLGLLPLATGFNIDFFGLYANFDPDIFIGGDNAAVWGPMAWTVIYGLTFATFLTLVVVPAMYVVVDQLGAFFSPGVTRTTIAEQED